MTVLLLALLASDTTKPAMLEGVDVVEHVGDTVPMDIVLTDATGHMRPLRSFVSGKRPVLLTLVYYKCPMLCNVLLGGMVRGLRETGWALGREYDADFNISRCDRRTRNNFFNRDARLTSAPWPGKAGMTPSLGSHDAGRHSLRQRLHARRSIS